MPPPPAATAAPSHPTSHVWLGPGEYAGTARLGTHHTPGHAAAAAAPMPLSTAVAATAAVPLAVALAAESSAARFTMSTAASTSAASAGAAAAAAAPSRGLMHSVSQSWRASRERYSSSVWIPVVLIPVAIYFVITLAQTWSTRHSTTKTRGSGSSTTATTTTHTHHHHHTTHNATTHHTTVLHAETLGNTQNAGAEAAAPTQVASDVPAAAAARPLPAAVLTAADSGASHVQRTPSAVVTSTGTPEAKKPRSAPHAAAQQAGASAQPSPADSPRTPRTSNAAAPVSAPGSGSARLRQNSTRAPQTPATPAAAATLEAPTPQHPSVASVSSSTPSPAATPMSKRLASPRPSAISASRIQQQSMRPQFSASLDLPSRSGSRVQSAHQSRSHSPHSAGHSAHHRASTSVTASPALGPSLGFPMSSPRTSVSGAPGSSGVVAGSGAGSGSSSGSSSHSVTRAVSMSAMSSQYRVHWYDEIKLLGHVHPLKRGVGMAESFGSASTAAAAASAASTSASSTADVSASPSPSLNSVSGASAVSAAAIAARPMGYFNASFDPRSDVILLTGATSFVGVHLLHQLLQESSDGEDESSDEAFPLRHIVCIVRPASMALSTFDQDSTPVPSPGPDDQADSLPSTPRSRRSAHASTDGNANVPSGAQAPNTYAFHFPSSSSVAAQVQWERVRLTFESYGLPWHARYTRRLVLLPGDCALPHLGLDAFTYHQLVTSTHTIFHVAGESGITARASGSTPYSALKYSLVESTKRMLELAALQRRKILVFVSSVHVLRCPLSGDAHEERDAILQLSSFMHSPMPPHHMSSPSSASGSLSASFVGSSLASSFTHSNESTSLASFSSAHLDTLRNGFLQSKWVCEQLMAQAHERGVPCMVFRLGDVVASRDTGRGHHTLDPLGKLLTEFTCAGITLPESAGDVVNAPASIDGASESSSSLSVPVLPLLPVDEAARCMLFLASCYFQHHPAPPIAPLYAPSSLLTRESLSQSGLSTPKTQLQHHRANLSTSSTGSAADKRAPPAASYSALFSGASAASSSALLSAAPVNPSVMPVFHLLHSSVDAAHNKQSGISLATLLQWCSEYGFDLEPTAAPSAQSGDSTPTSSSSILSDFLQTLLSSPARSGISGTAAPVTLLSPAEVVDFFQCRWASTDGSEPSINDVETRVALREMQERVAADLAIEDEMDASNVSHSLILSRKQLMRLTADLDRPSPLDREWMFKLLDDLRRRRVLPPPTLLTSAAEAHRVATDMSAAATFDDAPSDDDQLEQEDDDDEDDGPASTLQFSPGAISPPAKYRAGETSATSTAPPSSSKATPLASRMAPRAIPSSASSSAAGGATVLLPLHSTPTSNIFTSPPPNSYVGSGGPMLVAPTPSAFLSPMPNGLSFHTPAGSEGVSTPDGKAGLNQSMDGSEALSPSKNLSFESGDSPMVSASKIAKSSPSGARPLAATSEQDEDGAVMGSAQIAPATGFGSVPSTPPTAKVPAGRKRVPPVPGGRGSQTISSAALRRSNLQEQADGAPPVAPRASRAAMGLAALLASPAPHLANGAASGLVTPAQPQPKNPLFSLESPSDSLVVPRASSALHSASSVSSSASKPSHQQETSLMAALNFAANSSAYGTPNGHATNGNGASSAASSSSQHHLGSSLASNRSPAASAALLALTSPMLVRAPSTAAAGWATCILPNLYLGNAKHAADLSALRAHGITHICNAADDVANFHESLGADDGFVYLNLHVKDCGQDEGIARVFLKVEQWVRAAGFVVPREEDIGVSGGDSTGPAAAASAGAARPVRILFHCAKGANRSVTIVLALLMLLYPTWSLDRAHSLLLAARHSSTCPFRDNRTELLSFELRLRGGVNSMTDKDFRTRIPAE